MLSYVFHIHVRCQIFLALNDIESGLHLQDLLGVIFDEFLYLVIQRVDHVLVLLVDPQQLDKRVMEQVIDHGANLSRDGVILWRLQLVKELLRLSYRSDGALVALMLVKDKLNCT